MKTAALALFGIFALVQILSPADARNVRPGAPAAPLRRSSSTPDIATAAKTAPAASSSSVVCTPAPSPDAAHFIIGYGSLMQSASKDRTVKGTGESIPVEVQGFRREWNLKGDAPGPDTTYLGVVADPKSTLNGVVFQLQLINSGSNQSVVEAIEQYDLREKYYCRQKVDIKNIKVLGGTLEIRTAKVNPEVNPEVKTKSEPDTIPTKAEYWIYVNKPEFIDPPTKQYPIVQSYVDIFVSGCLEQEVKFNVPDFAAKCVESTKGWNEFWLNDRIFPRRPFVHQPKAGKIDTILEKKLPDLFEKIQIEG